MQTQNYMPMVHQARRLITGRAVGNPFVSDRELEQMASELSVAYLRCPTPRIAMAIKVELDRLETLV